MNIGTNATLNFDYIIRQDLFLAIQGRGNDQFVGETVQVTCCVLTKQHHDHLCE